MRVRVRVGRGILNTERAAERRPRRVRPAVVTEWVAVVLAVPLASSRGSWVRHGQLERDLSPGRPQQERVVFEPAVRERGERHEHGHGAAPDVGHERGRPSRAWW